MAGIAPSESSLFMHRASIPHICCVIRSFPVSPLIHLARCAIRKPLTLIGVESERRVGSGRAVLARFPIELASPRASGPNLETGFAIAVW
jgi:hypothetical protein